MIPITPVMWISKQEVDELGLSQLELRALLIDRTYADGAKPHPDGLGPNGKPEVVYRTIQAFFTPEGASGACEEALDSMEGYAIWIVREGDEAWERAT